MNSFERSPATGERVARICCLDLDMFFVSVERLLNPSLRQQPVIVGAGPGQRGVVLSASYEVRALGVRSGMPMKEARRLAPSAHFVAPSGDYGGYAKRVRAILERYAPQVQTASIDEFLLDFHGCEKLYRRAEDQSDDAALVRVLHEVRSQITGELGLPASAGVGCTRIVAKMASGLAKPLRGVTDADKGFGSGVVLVPPGSERAWLGPLPLRRFPGIGPAQEARLKRLNLHTIEQLLALSNAQETKGLADLKSRLGQAFLGETSSLGRDRPAFREHDAPGGTVGSISNEATFGDDLNNDQAVTRQLLALVQRVCWRARSRGVCARTITVKLRYTNFETLQRSRTGSATADDAVVFQVAKALVQGSWEPSRAIRLLGVALSNLDSEEQQLTLPFAATTARSSQALDKVRSRFGYAAIQLGGSALRRQDFNR